MTIIEYSDQEFATPSFTYKALCHFQKYTDIWPYSHKAFHNFAVSMSSFILLILIYNFTMLSDKTNYNSILFCDFQFLTRFCLFSRDDNDINKYIIIFFSNIDAIFPNCDGKKSSVHSLIAFLFRVPYSNIIA